MQEMGIAAVYPGPNLSKRHADHHVYPYLLRQMTAAHPNHIWGVDITYVRLRGSWLYLVAILDWYSRYVVNWMLDDTFLNPLCAGSGGSGPVVGHADDLEQRPGEPLHQSAVHPAAGGCRCADQYGWTWSRPGHHLYRTVLAVAQIRGDVSA
jgi:integrase-like protein